MRRVTLLTAIGAAAVLGPTIALASPAAAGQSGHHGRSGHHASFQQGHHASFQQGTRQGGQRGHTFYSSWPWDGRSWSFHDEWPWKIIYGRHKHYAPAGCDLDLGWSWLIRGHRFPIGGFCFKPHTRVTFSCGGKHIGTIEVDGDGSFETNVTLPGDESPGTKTIVASGLGLQGGPISESSTVTVQ